MIAFLFAGMLAAAPVSDASTAQDAPRATATRGVAGVCLRWDRQRRSRVAEAVIVQSSGNAALDARISTAVPQMDWPVGEDNYRGQWIGVWMAVGGAASPPDTTPLPDCSSQHDRSWAPAPASALGG